MAGIEIAYQMRNYGQDSFFQFQPSLVPADIGNAYNLSTGTDQGTELPVSNDNSNSIESRKEDSYF